jgi:hypothetical protein
MAHVAADHRPLLFVFNVSRASDALRMRLARVQMHALEALSLKQFFAVLSLAAFSTFCEGGFHRKARVKTQHFSRDGHGT